MVSVTPDELTSATADPVLPLWEHVRRLRKITEAAVTDEACEAEHIMARTPLYR